VVGEVPLLQHQTIAVVVPAYNEERLLPKTLASIPDFIDQVIVVDDASRDATSESALRSKRPGLTVERHAHNQGVGAAIVTGYKRALRQGADIVVVMAADAQMDPSDLRPLLAPIVEGHADYTKGNRLSHPEVFRVMPWSRLAGSYALSLLTRPLSGYWSLLDSQCGYTAIHRRALERLDLDALYPRYGYPNDLLIQLGARRLRAQDVTVRPVYGDETSGFRPLTVAPKIMYVLGRALVKRLAYHAKNQ
jgi:dolichol-phosphate mannosyltransferase